MRKMDYQNVKGTRDYLPEAEETRVNIKRTLEDVFIQYGCKPLETPILNYNELLASKYGGGAEILEEMYKVHDRGGRDLSLRYDLTIPFAKVVAMNPNLSKPFKRYEIGKVFRDGPIKTGRFREFTQCDVDIVGVESQAAETELMLMAIDAFNRLNLSIVIQYNNRRLLFGILKIFNVPLEFINSVILTIDKLEKIGIEGVIKELSEKDILSEKSIQEIKNMLVYNEHNKSITFFEQYSNISDDIEQGITEIKELSNYLDYLGISKNCVFNPFLARGLEIYTGTVYEIFLNDGNIKSSIGSGGRYDNAIGGMIGTNETFSTVGISFGLDVIYAALELSNRSISNSDFIDFYIIPIKTLKESLKVSNDLRGKGYSVEVEMSNKKISKALDKANKEKFKNVIIIGEDEVKNKKYKVKNMDTGKEVYKNFKFD